MTVKKYLSKIESFKGRKIVLVGGTSGIGLSLLSQLKEKESSVILLARNVEKANSLKSIYPIVDVIEYDQSSFKSIEHAISELVSRHNDFDTIVMNVGTLGEKQVLDNGYPATIGVNYIGARHFIDTISNELTNKVRFVVQGSVAAGCNLKKPIDITNPKLGTFRQYNVSKAYLEAYIYKLYNENKYSNLEYIITEPGVTSTNITRHFNKLVRVLGKYFLLAFFHHSNKASLCLLTGISDKSHNGDYIVPRGLFSLSGFPKIKSLPQKRRRLFLFKE